MADDPKMVPIQQIPGPQTALPTTAATHFSLSLTVTEFMIALGHSRSVMTQTDQGIAATLMQEWFLGLSISPVTAALLHRALGEGLTSYEAQFGTIPHDKATRVGIGEMPGISP